MTELEKILKLYPIGMVATYEGRAAPGGLFGTREMYHYKVQLTFEGRSYVTEYWKGGKRPPDVSDVIHSMIGEYYTDTSSFKRFCEESDYSAKSPAVRQGFDLIKALKPGIKAFFGSRIELFRAAIASD